MGYLAFHHYPETGDKAQGARSPRSHKEQADVPHSASTRETGSATPGELPCDPVTGEVDLPSAPLKPGSWGALPRPLGNQQPPPTDAAFARGNVFLAGHREHVKYALMPSGFFLS